MSRNSLWTDQEFKDWCTAHGRDWRGILCFASNHHLRKIVLEYHSSKQENLEKTLTLKKLFSKETLVSYVEAARHKTLSEV